MLLSNLVQMYSLRHSFLLSNYFAFLFLFANVEKAEDRCHRIGQTREVHIHRLISKETIEEGMFAVAQEKLRLEQRITGEDGEAAKTDAQPDKSVLGQLLKRALNDDNRADEN